MYKPVSDRLAAGETIVLDGGTGTDIQHRGVAMDSDVWCAQANLDHPGVVREVHADYIRAGAEVITANTYASSPLLFNALGRDADLAKVDGIALRLAREAIEETGAQNVAVAGSMSILRPLVPGTDQVSPEFGWSEDQASALFRAKADGLAEAGADLIIVEMMRDLEVSLWATRAAVATGLPVWCGIAVERDADGLLMGYNTPQYRLDELIQGLMSEGPVACLIMHSRISDTDEALSVVASQWTGPMGAYPEAGEFKMPDWQFQDVSPEEFTSATLRWQDMGARILGGCCGIGPDHIAAMAKALRAGERVA